MKLKRIKVVWVIGFLAAFTWLLVSFKQPAEGVVHGNIIPARVGLRAFLFSGKDTLSANVVNDAFQFSNVAPGNYKLLIEAAPPYRNAVKEGLRVTEGEFTDAGQIELQK